MHDSKKKPATPTTPLPIDKRLHRLLKQRALDEGRTLREIGERILGAAVKWKGNAA